MHGPLAYRKGELLLDDAFLVIVQLVRSLRVGIELRILHDADLTVEGL
jgi:hypothetical protein